MTTYEKMACMAIEDTKENEELSPFFRVLYQDNIPYRPFLYEDEKCVVLSSDDPSLYYFKVVPRKPISMLGKPNIEESHLLLREYLVCIAKNLANEYGLADVFELFHDYGFPGSRFSVHFNINVINKNGHIDPASVSFEKLTPATTLEVAEQIQELKNAFEEYATKNAKYSKFCLAAFFYLPGQDWRSPPQDTEMREVLKMQMLQKMFPYTFIQDQPFSFFVENLPHYIPEVQQLEENLYHTADSPLDYYEGVWNLIDKVQSMYREKYHLPGYMTPGLW